MIHVNPNRKGTPKVKRIKISLEERPGNNLYALCKHFKSKPDEYNKKMTVAISAIINIMDGVIESTPDDIKEIDITKVESKTEIQITFKRYIGCKLIDYLIHVNEFKAQYPMINPSIPN